eukprot:Opistho-2@51562
MGDPLFIIGIILRLGERCHDPLMDVLQRPAKFGIGQDIELVRLHALQHILGQHFGFHTDGDHLFQMRHDIGVRAIIAGTLQMRRAGQHRFMDVAVDCAGAEHRHADAVVGQIQRQTFGEAPDRHFQRAVNACPLERDEGGHGRGIDDMPALAPLYHTRHEGLDAVDDALQIDVQLPIPVIISGVLERAEDRHARRVEQQLDRPQLSLHRVGGALIGIPVGDIQFHRHHIMATPLEPGHRLVQMVLPDVDDRDLAAGLRKHLRLPQRHARSAAGDEGGTPRYLGHAASSFALRRASWSSNTELPSRKPISFARS